MKKLHDSPAQILLYIAIGLCCSTLIFFLVNAIADRTLSDWLATEDTRFYDWITIGTIILIPVIASVWTGLTKENLWTVPVAGIAGGVGGILLLVIIHFLLIAICIFAAIALLAGMER